MIGSHRFPMYKCDESLADLDYITNYLITSYGEKILKLASPGGAGRNKTLGQDLFLERKIHMPQVNEQKKIANFLKTLNKRISCQEDLIERLKSYKRGLLSQLFSQKFVNSTNTHIHYFKINIFGWYEISYE